MTAISLFDLLARSDQSGPPADAAAAGRLARFADRMVESILGDLERLRGDEQVLLDTRGEGDDGLELDLLRSLWNLYGEWSRDADQVLSRVRQLRSLGHAVRDADRLEDAYGSVRARLSVTPEQVIQGRDSVRQGQAIPAKELRDELRTRLRA
jgi:hypothetical protein